MPYSGSFSLFATRSALIAILISNPVFANTPPLSILDFLSNNWHAVLSAGGGLTRFDMHSQTFPIQNAIVDEFFIYTPEKSSQSKGYFDIFAGLEWDRPNWDLQLGVGFLQPQTFSVRGSLVQGADVQSQDLFHYSYKAKIRQILAEGKFLYNFKMKYHPYALLGLGVASNRAESFNTDVPPFLTFTRMFNNNTHTSFSYGLGIGIDVDITQHIRLGVGYRFSDFGKIQFGQASIDNTPVFGSLSQSHLHANAVLAQIILIC